MKVVVNIFLTLCDLAALMAIVGTISISIANIVSMNITYKQYVNIIHCACCALDKANVALSYFHCFISE
jgi:hypothetical protein